MDINYDMRPDLPDDEEDEIIPYKKKSTKTEMKEMRRNSISEK
jgi:hypothetical protein